MCEHQTWICQKGLIYLEKVSSQLPAQGFKMGKIGETHLNTWHMRLVVLGCPTLFPLCFSVTVQIKLITVVESE